MSSVYDSNLQGLFAEIVPIEFISNTLFVAAWPYRIACVRGALAIALDFTHLSYQVSSHISQNVKTLTMRIQPNMI
jgi:hypothetical protein